MWKESTVAQYEVLLSNLLGDQGQATMKRRLDPYWHPGRFWNRAALVQESGVLIVRRQQDSVNDHPVNTLWSCTTAHS